MNPSSLENNLHTEELYTEQLRISGLRCTACIQLIEFRVRKLKGVGQFDINPSLHKAKVSWDNKVVDLKLIIQTIVNLGYAAFPANQTESDIEKKQKRTALWRIFIAGFAMMQVMMYAFPAYLVPVPEVNGDLTPDLDFLLKLASFLICIPVVVFSAQPFFKGAWTNTKHAQIGMDVPVAVGIIVTFVASIVATFHGGTVYFDSVIMFVFFLLGARFIEQRIQDKSQAALRVLTQLHPLLAQRLLAYPHTQDKETIHIKELKQGDIVIVAAGEQIPADGIVLQGQSECDEALMTGEANPVLKSIGASVIAGAINVQSTLIIQTQQVGDNTQLAHMLNMMEAAAKQKPPLVALADKHASHFLMAIMFIAVASFIVWWQIDADRALLIAVSVIIVTCPCALSLATPGVMSAAVGNMANNGILVAKPKAIESLAQAKHFVFDKTGTLTHGKLRLLAKHNMLSSSKNISPENTQLAIQLASQSMHPVAKAIADDLLFLQNLQNSQHSQKNPQLLLSNLSHIKEIAGKGIQAQWQGDEVRLGNLAYVQELSSKLIHIDDQFSNKTLSVLANKNGAIALFVCEDTVREEAFEAISKLKQSGAECYLFSGDNPQVVQNIAEQLHITHYQGGMSPEQKYDRVKQLQAQGLHVVMVGDGMNDGPALSLANVSIAMGQGAPISQTRSDLLLMSNRLLDLELGVRMSRKAMQLIRQNLAWAVLYNVIAIPAAVLGYLEPWHAALGMSLSSLIVVVNGLRLLKLKADYAMDYTLQV